MSAQRASDRARPREARVLVVDDDPMVRNLLAAVLQDTSFVLEEAASGDEALRRAFDAPPDIVILDVMMPGTDGYEVCRRLRSHPATANARIVMLTAKTGAADREIARDAGADAFFTKPFSPLDLIESVTERGHGAA